MKEKCVHLKETQINWPRHLRLSHLLLQMINLTFPLLAPMFKQYCSSSTDKDVQITC